MRMSVVLGAIFALLLAPVANAAVVTFTYTGTVTEGVDTAGLLGFAGADLTGLDYIASISLDTQVNRHTPGLDGEDDAVYGPDTEGNLLNPFLSVVVTLDGVDIAFPLFGTNYAYASGGSSMQHTSGIAAPNFWDFYAEGAGVPGSLDTPFGFAPNGQSYADASLAGQLWFRGDVSRVSSGAVPEPATWALMIAGFGLAGSMLRRRQHVLA